MVKLKCPRCEKKWNYTGDNKYTATCPDCRKLVKIGEDKIA